jgi:uncharacterized membrane protein
LGASASGAVAAAAAQVAYAPTAQADAASGGLSDNLAGALAYLLIPAILFLALEPYEKNKFVRFHSFQCLLFGVGCVVLWIALGILGTMLSMIPFIGWIVTLILFPLINLLVFVLGLFLMFKAYKGETYELPVLGAIAEKQANVV